MMKKLLFVIVSLSFITSAKSQDSLAYTSKKHELNIGYFNAFNLTSGNDFGVGYKYTFRNGALRIGTTFSFSNDKTTDDGQSMSENETKNLSIKPRIGYEFHQNYKRIMVYYGADFITYIEDYHSNYTYNNSNNDTYYSRKYTTTTSGFGISPLLGLKYFINKKISISTETSFNFAYKKSENKYDYFDDGSSTPSSSDSSERKSYSANLSPLGIISINFHF